MAKKYLLQVILDDSTEDQDRTEDQIRVINYGDG